MKDIVIREYKPQDFQSVVNLTNKIQEYFVAIDKTGYKKPFSSQDDSEKYVEHVLKDVSDMNGAFYVAVKNNFVVGFIYGVIISEKNVLHKLTHHSRLEGWIGLLYVDEGYRGQGLGKRLIERVKDYFKEKGCSSMRLVVDSNNINAINHYSNLGFETYEIKMTTRL